MISHKKGRLTNSRIYQFPLQSISNAKQNDKVAFSRKSNWKYSAEFEKSFDVIHQNLLVAVKNENQLVTENLHDYLQQPKIVETFENPIFSLEFEPDTGTLLVGDSDSCVREFLFDEKSKIFSLVKTYADLQVGEIRTLDFKEDLLLAGGFQKLAIVDLTTMKVLSPRVDTALKYIHSVRFCTLANLQVLVTVAGLECDYSDANTDVFDLSKAFASMETLKEESKWTGVSKHLYNFKSNLQKRFEKTRQAPQDQPYLLRESYESQLQEAEARTQEAQNQIKELEKELDTLLGDLDKEKRNVDRSKLEKEFLRLQICARDRKIRQMQRDSKQRIEKLREVLDWRDQEKVKSMLRDQKLLNLHETLCKMDGNYTKSLGLLEDHRQCGSDVSQRLNEFENSYRALYTLYKLEKRRKMKKAVRAREQSVSVDDSGSSKCSEKDQESEGLSLLSVLNRENLQLIDRVHVQAAKIRKLKKDKKLGAAQVQSLKDKCSELESRNQALERECKALGVRMMNSRKTHTRRQYGLQLFWFNLTDRETLSTNLRKGD